MTAQGQHLLMSEMLAPTHQLTWPVAARELAESDYKLVLTYFAEAKSHL